MVVSNPLTTKAIASAKVKTDKIDARRLATALFGVKGLAWLPTATTFDPHTRAALDVNLRRLDATQHELDTLDPVLADLGYSEPKVKLRISLPGVDDPSALALLAAWGDLRRFRDTNYLGLAPNTRQNN